MPLDQENRDTGKSPVERAAHGFAEAAREAWETPVATAYGVGMGLAVGAVTKTLIDKGCAHLGSTGVIVKGAIAVAPLAVSLFKTAESKDGAEDLGRSAFDLALFWGAGKLGHVASSGIPRIAAPDLTETFEANYKNLAKSSLWDLERQFNLPKIEADLAPLNKTGFTTRSGTPYNIYESTDFKTKVLLDEKMTRSFAGTEHPYKGVDLGMYPLRGLREFFALPNRDTVAELRFNALRDGRSAAFVPAEEANIIVNSQRVPAQRLFRHEYMHTVSNTNPQLRKAYWTADALDASKRISTYAGKNPEESLADTVGLGLIGQSGQDFIWTVHNNPLRSFVANRYITKELAAVAPESRSVFHDAFLARGEYIDKIAPAIVTPLLEQASSQPGLHRQAVRVLMNELKANDTSAADLLTSARLERNLARGGALGPVIDKLHTKTELYRLSLGAFGTVPAFSHIARQALFNNSEERTNQP